MHPIRPILAGLASAAALVLVACATPGAPGAGRWAIVGANLVHVDRDAGSAIERDMTVIVSGDHIEAIVPTAQASLPPGLPRLDARGRWLIPGLIDAHVHFFQSGNLFTRPDVVDLNDQVPYAREVARNQARLEATFGVWLASGVTGVVDVGGPMWNFDVRERARRVVPAPRVAVAGPLISLVDDPQLDLGDPPIIQAHSPAEARALAERQLSRRPDWIKVWFIHGPKDDLAAQTEIVRQAAEAAHAAGVPLAVHATVLAAAKAALKVGADFLVHSVEDELVDDEFIELMRRNRALYCPTLYVIMGYDWALSDQWTPTEAERRLADPQVLPALRGLSALDPQRLPAWVQKALRERHAPGLSPVMAENLRRVVAAGLPVVMGTDAGNIGTLHGPSVFRELALMQQAGLTPLQVLRSATLTGARALRMEDRLGPLAPGRLADLVLLDGNPLEDLSNLSRAWRVIKGGAVYDPQALAASLR